MKRIAGVLLAVAAVGVLRVTAGEPATIALRCPQDYQVVQRQSRSGGAIRVEGTADGGSSAVEGRVGEGGWRKLALDADGHAFRGELPASAGGWYAVEVRGLGNGGRVVVGRAVVAHVGVGEVFVVAGQSNSCNYGAVKQSPASGKVAAFDGERWSIANDPQPGGGGKGGSFIPAFGDALVKRLGVPVGVAACGVGATSVRQWLPNGARMTNEPTTDKFVRQVGPGTWESTGQPFDAMIKRMEALGPHGFRAVLWHQGESDAGQARGGAPVDRQITGEQYRQFLEQVIRASRQRAKWDVPWFVAQATYHSEKDASDEEFRAAQRAVCADGLALAGPDTDSLGAELRSGVHFNAAGLVEHGRLWAEKVGPWIEPEVGR